MKSGARKILLGLFALFAGLLPASYAEPSSVPPPLLEKPFLYEVVRHLYRWYMDEADVQKAVGRDLFEFRVRARHPKLDPGDKSSFGEIVLPSLGIIVQLKKPDYTIEETRVAVSSKTFRITGVGRAEQPTELPENSVRVEVSYAEMRDYLFRTRNQAKFPEGDLLMRLRLAAREEILEDIRESGQAVPGGDQIIHLAPLSPAANEAWVFWETGRLLIRFASDIDLENPAMWAHADLAVKLYDIDEQVVVSLDEVAGSNAYLTRDQVGRALFNCIILGKRLVLEPLQTPTDPDTPEL